MFYFIYLFSSAVLILCSDFVKSDQHQANILWSCANEKCDSPISEFKTTSRLPQTDHSSKLRFELGSNGKVLKKPLDGSEYWFVEIDDNQGFVNKNSVREIKKLNEASFQIQGVKPFNEDLKSSGGAENISPSQPTVIDGTTFSYDTDSNESEDTKGLPVSNSAVDTPPLSSKHIPTSSGDAHAQSTSADSVDQNKLGLQKRDIVDDGNTSVAGEASASLATANESQQINSTDGKSGVSSVNSNNNKLGEIDNVKGHLDGNVGVNGSNIGSGSSTPLDDYDDTEVSVEEDNEEDVEENMVEEVKEELEEDSVPSDPPSTDPKNQVDGTLSNGSTMIGPKPADKNEMESAGNNTQASSHEVEGFQASADNQTSESPPEVASTDAAEVTPPVEQGATPSRFIKHNRSPYVSSHPTRQAPKLDQGSTGNDEAAVQNEQIQYTAQNEPSQIMYNQLNAPPQEQQSPQNTEDQANIWNTNDTSFTPQVSADTAASTSSPGPSLAPVDSATSPSSVDTNDPSSSSTNVNAATPVDGLSTPPVAAPHSVSPAVDTDSPTTPSSLDVDGASPSPQVSERAPTTPSSLDIDGSSPSPGVSEHAPTTHTSSSPSASADSPYQHSINQQADVPRTIDPSVQTYQQGMGDLQFNQTKDGDNDILNDNSSSVSNLNSETSPDAATLESTKTPSYGNERESAIDQDEPQSTTVGLDHLPQGSTNLGDKLTDAVSPDTVETTQDRLLIDEASVRDSSGFYSSVSSFFSSLTELFNKSELPPDRLSSKSIPSSDNLDDAATPSTAPPGYCYDGEGCGGLERPIGGEDHYTSQPSQHYPSVDLFRLDSVPLSFNSLMYICITSVVVLLFSLGYYYIDKWQNSSALVAKVNELGQELFVTKKERDTLEDQLLKIKENCNMMDTSKIKQDSKLTSLQNALQQSESARGQLEETVSKLEKEVEMLMEQGMEMHRLLSDTISEEERSQILLANVDELKESLSQKLDQIISLSDQLDNKNEEIQLRQIDVRNANDRITELERKLESCKAETEEKFSKKLEEQQQKNIKLQKLVEEKGVSVARLEKELAKTKVERDSAEARASSAEAGLQSAHSVGAGEARQSWLDATAVRAALATANKQNETLLKNINEITSNSKSLQDKISSLNEELSDLNSKYENVEKEKVNALTKLQVLSDYFKEKETKLQEELGVKESQWLQKETEDHTIYEQMKSLREEIASYKSQNDKLKAEILEQEASYKVQIANEEQKSYDNWVALRQAERKVKELQMEAAHFRNRLTQIETANQTSAETLNPNGLDKSSLSGPSPPFMMLPPLPASDFFPLPPPPIHPSASRPPPLGRISSPQLTGEMIPPPPLVPFDLYPPAPSSTPPPLYKPQPRDRPPPPKDSPPSNYSSESVNDKPARRRRR